MRRTIQRGLWVLLLLSALVSAVASAPAAADCCTGKRNACEANCAPCGGVFEFNCDPATCQSSCICFICP